MRVFLFLSVCLFFRVSFGQGTSPYQKVWAQLKDLKDTSWINETHVGGIFIDNTANWNPSLLDKFSIALLLDEAFDPGFTGQELPDLTTLSAIDEAGLLHQYLTMLREISRKEGIDYLIMPSDEAVNQKFQWVLDQVHHFDSTFYVPYSRLTFFPDLKKKAWLENYAGHFAMITDSIHLVEKAREFNRIGKIKKFVPSNTAIENQPETPEPLVAQTSLSPMLHQIRRNSTLAFVRENASFPIKGDTIAIWQGGVDQIMATQLRNYYPVVLNVRYDKVPKGVPVVLDARFNLFQAQEFALGFSMTNPVIWLCDYATMANVNATVMLVTPWVHADHDFLLPDMIYGIEPIKGVNRLTLPPFMMGMENSTFEGHQLLTFALPEWVGMRREVLDSIDLLAEEMVLQRASPGAQVVVIKDGRVVWNKSYGYVTYDSMIRVEQHTLYDVASLTKVAATLPAIMLLHDQGLIHLDSTVGHYLPMYRGSNKENISLRSLLSHNSGLRSYIPFWKRPVNKENIRAFYYRDENDSLTNNRMYIKTPDPVILDSLQSWLRASAVDSLWANGGYRYSDLGFMILHQLVEEVSGNRLDTFVEENFYRPLGLDRTVFNPLHRTIPIYQIAPTEYDQYLRKEQVWGVVHDRNAAIFGGVAGHAGLFSTARDLAVFTQMMLQEGYYGDHIFISPGTTQLFNKQYFEGNRRGLGWDKPGTYNANISALASPDSFGHTGFTGTMIWADPQYGLVYVFLSNRIFPDGANRQLIQLDTRRKIHDLVYRSMMEQ